MKICYFDAFSGISGDMTVGALLDAGADSTALVRALDSLETGASFRVERTKRRGIAATKFHVDGGEQKAHRHLPHILQLIERGDLPDTAKQNAARVFERLGEAEAKVHDMPLARVHFHEVGAADSICDIVGACTALALLGIEQVHCSAINVGSGTVNTEHGVLPVPAPATAELLSGCPVYSRGPAVELTTPTGAALATTLAVSFGTLPGVRVARTGYGAGSKDFPEHANVLRAIIGETREAPEAAAVTVLEANIDDSNPQVLGYAMERLLDAGALDVTLAPVLMKKNRPGTVLSVIARPEDRDALVAIIFSETTTLGLRFFEAARRTQERAAESVETSFGAVRVKVGENGGFAPEYDDCRAVALRAGVPLKKVLAEASLAYLTTKR